MTRRRAGHCVGGGVIHQFPDGLRLVRLCAPGGLYQHGLGRRKVRYHRKLLISQFPIKDLAAVRRQFLRKICLFISRNANYVDRIETVSTWENAFAANVHFDRL